MTEKFRSDGVNAFTVLNHSETVQTGSVYGPRLALILKQSSCLNLPSAKILASCHHAWT